MIKIYSTKNCKYCIQVKEFLKEKDVEFEEKKIDDDQEALQEMRNLTGIMSVPVIEHNGKVVIGFDKEKIEELI